jgi:hypothetical protein
MESEGVELIGFGYPRDLETLRTEGPVSEYLLT